VQDPASVKQVGQVGSQDAELTAEVRSISTLDTPPQLGCVGQLLVILRAHLRQQARVDHSIAYRQ
jgi:hypothetical protein